MITLQPCKAGIAIAAMFAVSGAFAATGDKTDYKAAKERISAENKADKAVCDSYSGNKKDICLEQAKGKEKVALAEAEFNYTGKPDDANKSAVARADADYAVAKEMCDDKGGNEKSICQTDAKSTHTKALADAKLNKKVGEARQEATEDKSEAGYKLEAQKCDNLAGDAKNSCIAAAKAKFNKS